MVEQKEVFIVDSHCHLDYLLSDKPLAEIKSMAHDLAVRHFLTISVEEKHWAQLQQLAQEPDIDCAIGIHPVDVVNAAEGWQDRLLAVANNPDVVAIGETGLDNYHDPNQKALQQQAFEAHAYVAKKTQKPLVIHMREATEQVLSVVRSHGGGLGILHCFSEDYEVAKQLLDLDMMISLSGIVTFKNAHKLHEVAQKIPLESMLIETDAPFLAPVPYRGKTNYPGYTRYVAEKIAELRGISWEEVAIQTTKNYFRVTKQAERY